MLRLAAGFTALCLFASVASAQDYRFQLTGSVRSVSDPAGKFPMNTSAGTSLSVESIFHGGPTTSTNISDGAVSATMPIIKLGGVTLPQYGAYAYAGAQTGRYLKLASGSGSFVELSGGSYDMGIRDVDGEYRFMTSLILPVSPDQNGNIDFDLTGGPAYAYYHYWFFNGTGSNTTSGDLSFNLTHVSITAVPEPASWAMMILGMGAVGSMMRRRKVATRGSYAV